MRRPPSLGKLLERRKANPDTGEVKVLNRFRQTSFLGKVLQRCSQSLPFIHTLLNKRDEANGWARVAEALRTLAGVNDEQGGFAKVYSVVDIDSQEVYAVKVVAKSSLAKRRTKEKVLRRYCGLMLTSSTDT